MDVDQADQYPNRVNPRKGNRMRIRRIFAAVIATAAFAGLGLTGAATATAAVQGVPSVVTPSECKQGGGTADLTANICKGGMYDGEQVD